MFILNIVKKLLPIKDDVEETENNIPLEKITYESYIRIVLKNFTNVESKSIKNIIKNIKILIVYIAPKYKQYHIKLSPVHKTDNWKTIDNNSEYFVLGIFHPSKNITPFCYIRVLVNVKDDEITLKEIKEVNSYVNHKNILS